MSEDKVIDLVWYRCEDDACDSVSRARVEMRTWSTGLPSPGPCPACRTSPMRFGGRARDVTGVAQRAREEHEASG